MDDFNEPVDGEERKSRASGMSDDEVSAVIDAEIADAVIGGSGALANARIQAMEYFLGLPQGGLAPSPIPGRSDFVSTDVAETIDWMLPGLIEIFTAGDDVVEFSPLKSGDEDGARQTTDTVNHVFYQENPGWLILYNWFLDALLQRNSIVRGCWDESSEPTTESYQGITQEQLAMLAGDDAVSVTEAEEIPDTVAIEAAQQQYQHAMQQWMRAGGQASGHPPPAPPNPYQIPPLYNVTVTNSNKTGRCIVENVPPEEFIIVRSAKRIGDGGCGVRMKKTVSWLRQQGYDEEVIEAITSDETADSSMDGEALARRSLEDTALTFEDDGDGDDSQREVWLTDWYTQIDVDGDGIAEWRRILRAGNGVLLENEPCDGPPFASLCPAPLPHLFYGRSIADMAMPIQKLRTTIWRGLIDNMHLGINGRTWAVEGQVNLDDLLNVRAGGVVRVKNAQAVGPLQQGLPDVAGAQQMLAAADEMRQDRTGITRYTQGSDADTLNKTAQGLDNITQRADMRVKLVARIFAETGVKDLFVLIQKMLARYQDRAKSIKLNGRWVDVDPRAWKNRYSMVANVGLGTGDKTKQVQHLMTLGTAQKEAVAIGAATPANIYKTLKKLPPLLGFKDADEFFTDPSTQQSQEPPQDPVIEQLKVQHEAKMAEIQARAQMDAQRNELEDARERAKQQRDFEFEREKFYASLAMQRELAILKAGIQQQQKAQLFDRTLESEEPYAGHDLNGDGATGGQPAHGINAPGGSSAGAFDGPAHGGGVFDNPGGIQPGMGQQPGA
jgi:hypothetical protein